MIERKKHIITFRLGKRRMKLIRRMAEAACIGGRSHVRSKKDRNKTLREDQVVGQIGQYVGSLWLTGSEQEYLLSRFVANQNPTVGDGGSDVLASNIDFKTSLMRNPNLSILSYRLLVRPRERHEGWVYVLVLIDDLEEFRARAHLVGWAADHELPEPEERGKFRGASVIQAKHLHPLPPFSWLHRRMPCSMGVR